MVGDWQRVSGTMCSQGYRIATSGSSLSRAFFSDPGWGTPSTASSVVNDSTVAWGTTQLRYSGGRIYVSDSNWSSGCEFTRGAPTGGSSSSSSLTTDSSSTTSGSSSTIAATPAAWRTMAGDWQRVSGSGCEEGFRIALSGDTLTRALASDEGWAPPATASRIVNDSTVAWGTIRLRYRGGRISRTDTAGGGACEFVPGAPTMVSTAPSPPIAAAPIPEPRGEAKTAPTMALTDARISMVIGGVVGGAFVLLVGGAVFFISRRRRPRAVAQVQEQVSAPTPEQAIPLPDSEAVFVSYAREDAPVVIPVCEAVIKGGRHLWLDIEGIDAGQNWARQIVIAIRTVRGVVVMCSKAAFESDHVRREVYLASRYNKHLLPVFIEATPMPEDFEYFFAGVQWLKLHEAPESERPALMARALTSV
jgi:hypothetical protein